MSLLYGGNYVEEKEVGSDSLARVCYRAHVCRGDPDGAWGRKLVKTSMKRRKSILGCAVMVSVAARNRRFPSLDTLECNPYGTQAVTVWQSTGRTKAQDSPRRLSRETMKFSRQSLPSKS